MTASLHGGPYDGITLTTQPALVLIMAVEEYRMRSGSHLRDEVVHFDYFGQKVFP